MPPDRPSPAHSGKACLATVYTVITYILYWDSLLPLLISTAADVVCLVAIVVVACVVDKPVSYLSCPALCTLFVSAVTSACLWKRIKGGSHRPVKGFA